MSLLDAPADRGALLVDHGLRLLAGGGLGAVTHRAVETAAGVPHGSVTYWFASREGLVDAMLERCLGACSAKAQAIADGVAGAFASGAAPDPELVAAAIERWIDDDRELHLARLELELAGARDERLRERTTAAGGHFWQMCEPLAAALGAPDPAAAGRALAIMVDGILLDRIAHPPQRRAVVRSALAQLLRRWD